MRLSPTVRADQTIRLGLYPRSCLGRFDAFLAEPGGLGKLDEKAIGRSASNHEAAAAQEETPPELCTKRKHCFHWLCNLQASFRFNAFLGL